MNIEDRTVNIARNLSDLTDLESVGTTSPSFPDSGLPRLLKSKTRETLAARRLARPYSMLCDDDVVRATLLLAKRKSPRRSLTPPCHSFPMTAVIFSMPEREFQRSGRPEHVIANTGQAGRPSLSVTVLLARQVLLSTSSGRSLTKGRVSHTWSPRICLPSGTSTWKSETRPLGYLSGWL
jgi:hypothetical protein